MAANGFRTDTATMQGVAHKIAGIHTTLEADLGRLRQQLSGLAGQEWQGMAADAFATTMAQWDRDALRMNRALDWISGRVAQSANLMQTGQEQGAQAFRAVDGGGQGGGGLGQYL